MIAGDAPLSSTGRPSGSAPELFSRAAAVRPSPTVRGMFSVPRRDRLREQLLARAADDERLVAAAVTGSHAEGTETAGRTSTYSLYGTLSRAP